MFTSKKFWALGLVVSVGVAAFGCATQTQDDDSETVPDQSADELSLLRKGSVDHAAIVEVTTMMLVDDPLSDFPTVLDPYNEADPFQIRGDGYQDGFKRNIAKFDAEDSKTDWKPDQVDTWTARVATGNYLVVDTSKPCDFDNPHTYLEIERAQLTGRDHATCGGRMPNEDALDVTVNFLVRGPSASALDEDAVTDGVDQATKKATNEFPYLGEMNGF